MSALLVIWSAWVAAGVFYDPVVAPREKNGARHCRVRVFAMFAYCETLRAWIWLSRRFGRPEKAGKTSGELLAALFVIGSRIALRRVTTLLLPW